MEVGDCSLWHHLIFCEKMESDGNNKGVCWLCEESVLGRPAYKCLECNFLQHKSCSAMKMHVEHNLRERHHLMFKEELNNTANKEVVCLGCEEYISIWSQLQMLHPRMHLPPSQFVFRAIPRDTAPHAPRSCPFSPSAIIEISL
jgi:hypothetical protein